MFVNMIGCFRLRFKSILQRKIAYIMGFQILGGTSGTTHNSTGVYNNRQLRDVWFWTNRWIRFGFFEQISPILLPIARLTGPTFRKAPVLCIQCCGRLHAHVSLKTIEEDNLVLNWCPPASAVLGLSTQWVIHRPFCKVFMSRLSSDCRRSMI